MFDIFSDRADRTRLFPGAYRSQAQVDSALMRMARRDLGICDVQRVGESGLRVTLYSSVDWSDWLIQQIAAEFATV